MFVQIGGLEKKIQILITYQNLASMVREDRKLCTWSEGVLCAKDHLSTKDLGNAGLEFDGDRFILNSYIL